MYHLKLNYSEKPRADDLLRRQRALPNDTPITLKCPGCASSSNLNDQQIESIKDYIFIVEWNTSFHRDVQDQAFFERHFSRAILRLAYEISQSDEKILIFNKWSKIRDVITRCTNSYRKKTDSLLCTKCNEPPYSKCLFCGNHHVGANNHLSFSTKPTNHNFSVCSTCWGDEFNGEGVCFECESRGTRSGGVCSSCLKPVIISEHDDAAEEKPANRVCAICREYAGQKCKNCLKWMCKDHKSPINKSECVICIPDL